VLKSMLFYWRKLSY